MTDMRELFARFKASSGHLDNEVLRMDWQPEGLELAKEPIRSNILRHLSPGSDEAAMGAATAWRTQGFTEWTLLLFREAGLIAASTSRCWARYPQPKPQMTPPGTPATRP